MSKLLIPFVIMLMVWMTSCTSPQAVTATSVTSDLTTREIVASDTPKPVEKAIPTNTSTPLSSSPTPYPSLTPTVAEGVLTQQCLQENTSLPKGVVPPGILVVNTLGHGISLINSDMQTHRDITGVIISVGTSPDGKWLAYTLSTNNNLQIVFESMEGQKTVRIPKGQSWSLLGDIRWLDNQRIWFPEISTVQPATSILVLDPFTGQKELLKTDYPGTMHYQFGSGLLGFHFGYSSAVYDPSLNYVIYPAFEQDNGYFQTLWDRKSRKEVARISSSGYYQNLPIWQDSQKQFLVVGFPNPAIRQNEWLSVSLDGQIHQITDFGKIGQKYSIDNNATLSPDRKTLAFGLSFKKSDGSNTESTHLILLNLETGKVTDTCLSADKITWSLDGQYLAVSTPLGIGTQDRILLIDLKANQSYQLLEGSQVFPVGWVIQP